MTNREFDTLILGFAVGSFFCLWLGYRIGMHAERWKIERSARRAQSKNLRQHAKNIPFPKPGETIFLDHQKRVDGHDRLSKRSDVLVGPPQVIPLNKLKKWPTNRFDSDPSETNPAQPKDRQFIRISDNEFARVDDTKAEADETTRLVRMDAIAAITGAGYKRATAETALDACTLAERAGNLETWVASALRRLTAKP